MQSIMIWQKYSFWSLISNSLALSFLCFSKIAHFHNFYHCSIPTFSIDLQLDIMDVFIVFNAWIPFSLLFTLLGMGMDTSFSLFFSLFFSFQRYIYSFLSRLPFRFASLVIRIIGDSESHLATFTIFPLIAVFNFCIIIFARMLSQHKQALCTPFTE